MSLALMKSWIPSPVEEGKGKGGREGRKKGRKKEKKDTTESRLQREFTPKPWL